MNRKKANKAPNRAVMAGMSGCYAMGNFTDNFFKQAAIFLAAAMSLADPSGHGKALQGIATVLFALPFIIFSAYAGWMADRIQKKNIVVGAKLMELGALALGAFALWTQWWPGILAVIFIMAVQSTIFIPALNGAIPEYFPSESVPRVNSIIRTISTAAILAGMALAGPLLDARPGAVLPALGSLGGAEYGRLFAGIFAVSISVLGLFAAFLIKKPGKITPERRPFPWLGPVESFRHVMEYRKDRPLFTVMSGDAFFYGLAPIVVISIANLSKQFGYSDSLCSFLSACLMIGVAAGALLAGRSTPESWRRLMVPALTAMGVCLALASLSPLMDGTLRIVWFAGTLLAAGMWGGIYLIPITSYMQVRPKAGEKGKVLAASNFYSFMSMAIFGAAFWLVSHLPAPLTFVAYAALTLLFAHGWVRPRLGTLEGGSLKERSSSPLGTFMKALLGLRYRVSESGLEAIEAGDPAHKRPLLFLPNHPALIDPLIVYSRISGLRPRALSDENRMSGPIQKVIVKALRIITIPDPAREGRKGMDNIRRGLDKITDALKNGDNVLLYPSGRIYRSQNEELGANSAVAHILAEVPHARIVLVRSSGLWGSAFSRAGGKSPQFFGVLLRRIPALLANLIFFMPRRNVELEFKEAINLPAEKMPLNRELEKYYNAASQAAFTMPLYPWQGRSYVAISERAENKPAQIRAEIPAGVEERVLQIIAETSGLSAEELAGNSTGRPISRDMRLAADLGLDSLGLMELSSALEGEFGHAVPDLERLATVQDCLLAASGKLFDASVKLQGPPQKWFSMDYSSKGALPAWIPANSKSLASAFLKQVRKSPRSPLLAERSGMKTRKDILTAALVLARRFEKLPGKRLGLMLPAATAATVAWLAAQLAGKEVVMLNWTVGRRNFDHCARLAGLKHIITARALLEQLARNGAEFGDEAEFVQLEEIGASLGRGEKIRAFARASLYCAAGLGASAKKVPENAVILFTSGSESMPKGVPLTQKNILTNIADITQALELTRNVRVLGMLPAFHSFGFTVGITLPLATGLRVAFHPNPTESAALIGMVRDYKLNLLGATPTFLENMLSRADEPGVLASLRYAFVGAEKCPAHLPALFAKHCPGGSICEGYGITECSPVIAVNRPGNAVEGSIGSPLGSVECAVVLEDAKALAPAPAGTTGMLLVRGKSIFNGYLDSSISPFVEYMGKSWYRTGDLVQQAEDGMLYFKGRLSRFVKIAGEMISLPQMESILAEALMREAGEEGGPFVAIEAAEDDGRPALTAFTTLELNAQRINRILREAGLSLIYQVKNAVHLPVIPVLGTGKTDYQALKRMLAEKTQELRLANDGLTPAPALHKR